MKVLNRSIILLHVLRDLRMSRLLENNCYRISLIIFCLFYTVIGSRVNTAMLQQKTIA